MNIRLVAYRRENSDADTYELTNYELDLQKEPNVVVNYKWLDLKEPDKRKASFSQTIKIPFTNRNNQFFENWFDVNLDTLIFNTKTKFNAILTVDSIPQLNGFIQLKSIYLNARQYEIVIFGSTADFFTDIKDEKLKDAFKTQDTADPTLYLDDKQLDHLLTLENVVKSWTTGVTTTEETPTTTNDIMYPIIDWGHSKYPYSSSMFWKPDDVVENLNTLMGETSYNDTLNHYSVARAADLKPAIRIQRLLHIIAQKAGYQIKSTFLGIDDTDASTPITDTQFFSRLFMTLSSETARVQTLFDSSDSFAPFIGFKATMNTFSPTAIPCYTTGYESYGTVSYQYYLFDNEIYDPNNLLYLSTTDPGLPGDPISVFSVPLWCPTVLLPPLSDEAQTALLPQGSFYVKTEITITIPATTNGGVAISSVEVFCWWWLAMGGYPELVDNGDVTLTPGTHDIVFVHQIGATFDYSMQYQTLWFSPNSEDNLTGETWTPNITAATIQTVTSGEVNAFSGIESGEVSMYYNMPDITQSDFVKDLVNRFNLIVQTDAEDEKLLLIEPYQDYIDGGGVNYWTDKLDVSKEQVVKSTNELQSKFLRFSDLDANDYLNKSYKDLYDVTYGSFSEMRKNDFAKKEWKNFSIFAPYIAQGIMEWGSGMTPSGEAIPGADIALAHLWGAEVGGNKEVIEGGKPYLFYYSGTPVTFTGQNVNTGNDWSFHIFSNGFQQTGDNFQSYPSDANDGSVNKFPLCLQYNLDNLDTGVTTSTKELNWYHYSPNFDTGFTYNFFGDVFTRNGYYDNYWAQYINEIYSDEARIMDCYLNLTAEDVRSFMGSGFMDTYFIKNTLWRVISIDKYAVGKNKSTKVRLLKVIVKLNTACGNIPTIGNTGQITWVSAETGASVSSVTNNCCEEQNAEWTFVQSNPTTGTGQCYAFGFTFTPVSAIGGLPSPPTDPDLAGGTSQSFMLPMENVEDNFNVARTTGSSYGKSITFYADTFTLDNSTASEFTFKGMGSQLLRIPRFSMNYVKVLLLGTVIKGTNLGKCGYFEYDTVLINRGTNSYIGTAGGTLLKTNKDAAFAVPTLNITGYNSNGYWKPLITGGTAAEEVSWLAKVEVMSQPLRTEPTGLMSYALFQNDNRILFQGNIFLVWN